MRKPRILVTGASGKTGRATAIALMQMGFPVRAFVHREDHRSERLREIGAEVVVGKLQDIRSISEAMRGVQRAYFVCPWTVNQLDLALNFAIAANDNALEHIVAISQWLSGPAHPSVATRRTYLIDRILSWMPNTSWTIINVGFFADNYMALLEPISQLGLMPMPLGDGQNAPVSNEDIGRTAAGALAYPELHAGRIYRPTGPRLLSPQEIADTFGRVLDRKVKYQNISPMMFTKAVKAMGIPVGLISQLRHYFEDYRQGAFATAAPNDAVRHLTGREAESFETIVDRYVNSPQVTGFMPSATQTSNTHNTLINRLRAIRNFASLLITKAPDLEQYEYQYDYPEIDSTQYALASTAWKSFHDVPNAFGSAADSRVDQSDVAPLISNDQDHQPISAAG